MDLEKDAPVPETPAQEEVNPSGTMPDGITKEDLESMKDAIIQQLNKDKAAPQEIDTQAYLSEMFKKVFD